MGFIGFQRRNSAPHTARPWASLLSIVHTDSI